MTVVLVVLAVIVVGWALTMLASWWLLARRNRVTPGARTGAPLHWLAAPSRAAAAHRRLRRAVVAARAALDGMGEDAPAKAEVAACVELLERQAVDLDHRLVVAARCPPAARWRLVGDLEPQVGEVERIGTRLAEVAVTAPPRPLGAGFGFEALDARLNALAQARAELDAMEAGPLAAPPSTAAPQPNAAPPAPTTAPAAPPAPTTAPAAPTGATPALPAGETIPRTPAPGPAPVARERRGPAA